MWWDAGVGKCWIGEEAGVVKVGLENDGRDVWGLLLA
jgi:hypothetical protein